MTDQTSCTRLPCDTAHRGGTHRLIDGEQHHLVNVSSELVDIGELVHAWRVQVFAIDNGPWQVAVNIHPWSDEQRALFFTPGTTAPGREHEDSLNDFASALHRANAWALQYNLADAQQPA